MVDFGNDWNAILAEDFKKDYMRELSSFLKKEYGTHTVYPPVNDIFNALKYTPFESVRAVIIGQDPYHGQGQAHGLCFSVKKGVDIPPSLANIYKELHSDIGFEIPNHGCLTSWAKNGVLLLNAVLTVRDGEANSHKNKGWEKFTDTVIEKINKKEDPVVFLLWGNNAKAKAGLITNNRHLILEAAHPSPLSASRGFFGCRHFSKANRYLRASGLPEVDWTISPDK